MNVSNDEHGDVETQAAKWLVRLDRGRTPQNVAEQEAWAAQNPRNEVAYIRQAVAWKRMDGLRRLRPLDHHGHKVDPDLLRPKRKPFRLKFTWVAVMLSWAAGRERPDFLLRAVAGVTLITLLALGTLLLLPPEDGVRYSTEVGAQQHLVLDDGSVVDLNTNTSIRVQFSAAKREVLLERGEALFSVAHDASRPFEVTALGVTARAVGTRFSVRVYGDERVETLVTEGRVLVLRNSEVLGVRIAARPISRTLVAGERIVVNERSAAVSAIGMKEAARRLTWTTGKVAFAGEPLMVVVGELNRYTEHPLVIKDRGIARTAVGGGFDTRRAEAYAEDLVRFFGVEKLGTVEGAPARN